MANWKLSWEGGLMAWEIQAGGGDMDPKILPWGSLLTSIDTF